MNNNLDIKKYDDEEVVEHRYIAYLGCERLSTFGIVRNYVEVRFTRGFIIKLVNQFGINIKIDRDILYFTGDYSVKRSFETYLYDVIFEKLKKQEYINSNGYLVLSSDDINKRDFEFVKINRELKRKLNIETKEKERLKQENEILKQEIECLKQENEILKQEIECLKQEKEEK